MKTKDYKAISYAVLAAALYAVSSPLSKLLLNKIPAALMAALLYLGAGIGMIIVKLINAKKPISKAEIKLSKEDLPYLSGMVLLDIAAPILLMIGLTRTTSANVSLLNNFEIVATSLIALFIFKESISKKLWLGIILITVSSMILSFEGAGSFSFSVGSVFILSACICWGLENNCTRMLSAKDPIEVVIIKGIGSGSGSLLIAVLLKQQTSHFIYIPAALLLGFVAYGLSIFFYIYAQRFLGAAKTSAYYAVSPFIGAGLSLLIFRQLPTPSFLAALVIMIIGAYFASV